MAHAPRCFCLSTPPPSHAGPPPARAATVPSGLAPRTKSSPCVTSLPLCRPEMVSEMGGGQPPSPANPPFGAPLLNETHPVGVVTLPPAKPAPPVAPQQEQSAGESSDAAATEPVSQVEAQSEAMQLDGAGAASVPAASLPLLAPTSRSPSPFAAALKPSAAAAAAADEEQREAEQEPSTFVPVGELGGGSAAAVHAGPHAGPAGGGSPAAVTGSDGDEPSSLQPSAMERPVSTAGYESGDDMDLLSMQHCTNCTGPLWGHICMDCGHMTAHDDDIFNPTVAPAAALHRPRLQVGTGRRTCAPKHLVAPHT